MTRAVTGTFRILALNPGSTSTKVSVFEDEHESFTVTVRHPAAETARFKTVLAQLDFRADAVKASLADWDLASFDAVVARGGLIKPIESGTYAIDEAILEDSKDPANAKHASSLGAILAHELARELGLPAYIVDPVVVDELEPVARLSGAPGFPRTSIFHALNQKAVARQCARDLGLAYEDARLVVAHLGGGISIGAHRYGRVIDVCNALSGEGPFSPERCGALPAAEVIRACFSRRHTREEWLDLTRKTGGLLAYLRSNDLRECEDRIKKGDPESYLVVEAMAYQVSKEIGAMAAVLRGRLDAIVLTGGLAYSQRFVGSIKDRIDALAPVRVYPGEKEMEALALGALRVLRGLEKVKEYGEPRC